MNIVNQKIELKECVDSITDENIIDEILTLMSHKQLDFEKEWDRSISIPAARSRSKTMIESLPWNK